MRDEDELTNAWVAVNACHGILHMLITYRWLTENQASAKYFPKGGLPIAEELLGEAHAHITKLLIERDKQKVK